MVAHTSDPSLGNRGRRIRLYLIPGQAGLHETVLKKRGGAVGGGQEERKEEGWTEEMLVKSLDASQAV